MTTTAVTKITHERAYELIATLTKTIRTETASMLICTGLSAQYGAIHIVIPPLGDAIILPLATLNALL